MDFTLAWSNSFPLGYGHTSIAFLKRCPGFNAAKYGDADAANCVAKMCAKQDRLIKLRNQYPNAVLIPVLCQNKLPLALARLIGLPIWMNVWVFSSISRKLLTAMQRLIHKPMFVGYVKEGIDYIIVDDIITQGGTVATLREFVTRQGGNVVAVVALACAFGSHIIAPLKRNMVRLLVKFGFIINLLLQAAGIASEVCELTNSQIKYLLRFSSVKNIEKKVASVA